MPIEHVRPHIVKYGDPVHQVHLICEEGSSRTKQADRDQCDIQKLMNSFTRTGDLTHISESLGTYGDFTNPLTYREAHTQLAEAQQAFESFPSRIRERMRNDPGYFLDFMSDGKNLDEQIELGLVEAPKGYKKPEDTVVNPPLKEEDPPPSD